MVALIGPGPDEKVIQAGMPPGIKTFDILGAGFFSERDPIIENPSESRDFKLDV